MNVSTSDVLLQVPRSLDSYLVLGSSVGIEVNSSSSAISVLNSLIKVLRLYTAAELGIRVVLFACVSLVTGKSLTV